MEGYLEVTKDSLNKVAEVSGLPTSFWEREMDRINAHGGTLVVFDHDGALSQLTIDDVYDTAFVMKQKFGLEPV